MASSTTQGRVLDLHLFVAIQVGRRIGRETNWYGCNCDENKHPLSKKVWTWLFYYSLSMVFLLFLLFLLFISSTTHTAECLKPAIKDSALQDLALVDHRRCWTDNLRRGLLLVQTNHRSASFWHHREKFLHESYDIIHICRNHTVASKQGVRKLSLRIGKAPRKCDK